jgi:Fic family protein
MARRIKSGIYIHQQADWPNFRWDHESIAGRLFDVRFRQGRLIGSMQGLGFPLRTEAVLNTLTQDVLKSSEIEGETLDREQVRSSIARHLGIDIGGIKAVDRDVEGVVEMTLDATQNFDKPLTIRRLFDWHAALFPAGRSGMSSIKAGALRNDKKGAMQVVSGAIGKEKVHYEAPAAGRLRVEMNKLLNWFEKDKSLDLVLKAGVAHLWFVTIHPFDDGNGRIARAIADMQLARSEHSPQRFYSMSAQIRQERRGYYEILEATQKGGLDITHWLDWFLDCLGRAFGQSETILVDVLRKARFWERFTAVALNERQRSMVHRQLNGFEGKLTTAKWAQLAKCSHDTALRDIEDLIMKKILRKDPARGRSTSYSLAQFE